MSPEKPLNFSLISVLNPFTMATDKIITASPSIIPRIAILTISFEKVRFELNVIRLAMKKGKFNSEKVFLYLSKDAFFFNFV